MTTPEENTETVRELAWMNDTRLVETVVTVHVKVSELESGRIVSVAVIVRT